MNILIEKSFDISNIKQKWEKKCLHEAHVSIIKYLRKHHSKDRACAMLGDSFDFMRV